MKGYAARPIVDRFWPKVHRGVSGPLRRTTPIWRPRAEHTAARLPRLTARRAIPTTRRTPVSTEPAATAEPASESERVSIPRDAYDRLREAVTKIAEWQTHGPLLTRDAKAMIALARAALDPAATEPEETQR